MGAQGPLCRLQYTRSYAKIRVIEGTSLIGHHQVGPFDALPPAIGFVPLITAGGGGKTPVESFIALRRKWVSIHTGHREPPAFTTTTHQTE